MAMLAPANADRTTRALVDDFQRDFPLVARPYAEIGARIGASEAEIIERLRALREAGAISRIGAVVRPHAAGCSTLAAVAAPAAAIPDVARVINGFAGVNHNYEREHAFNLWFVVTGADRADIDATLAAIGAATGLDILDLPLERAYHIDLGFPVYAEAAAKPARRPLSRGADAEDRRILVGLAEGLPLAPEPYAMLAARLKMGEDALIGRIDGMIERGVVTRFGVIVRHRAFGYVANAMAVWDIADEAVEAIGARFADAPGVTLCYRRPRRGARWPYNLFTMVHGRTREGALVVVDALAEAAAPHLRARDALFSLRCFRQRGAMFAARLEAAE